MEVDMVKGLKRFQVHVKNSCFGGTVKFLEKKKFLKKKLCRGSTQSTGVFKKG